MGRHGKSYYHNGWYRDNEENDFIVKLVWKWCGVAMLLKKKG